MLPAPVMQKKLGAHISRTHFAQVHMEDVHCSTLDSWFWE